jgi:hypothetical protein
MNIICVVTIQRSMSPMEVVVAAENRRAALLRVANSPVFIEDSSAYGLTVRVVESIETLELELQETADTPGEPD